MPARLMIDSPAAPDRHGGRRPAIHVFAARSKKIVDPGLRRDDAEGGGRASIIMLPGISLPSVNGHNPAVASVTGATHGSEKLPLPSEMKLTGRRSWCYFRNEPPNYRNGTCREHYGQHFKFRIVAWQHDPDRSCPLT